MDPAIIEIMQAADDPINTVCSLDAERPALAQHIDHIQETLQSTLGYAFSPFWTVQDITYVAELTLKSPSEPGTYFTMAFSYFGHFFTIGTGLIEDAQPPDWEASFPADWLSTMIQIGQSQGFIYIASTYLDLPYTGNHPDFRRGTWRNRFFGTWDEL